MGDVSDPTAPADPAGLAAPAAAGIAAPIAADIAASAAADIAAQAAADIAAPVAAGIAAPAAAGIPATTFSIVGAGRVAQALGRVLRQMAGVTIVEVVARTPASAAAGVEFIGGGVPRTGLAGMQRATIHLLAVPDSQIAACAQELATAVDLAGTIVFHCSGALGADILAAARAAGAHVASVHPVRSFADPQQVAENFAGTCCGVEGDAAALAILEPLLTACGARVIAIDPAHKTLYHAAAVFASNYLVTLVEVAMNTYGKAGIAPADALALIGPLLRETADNALRLGPAAALTGPVARGDLATVATQHAALEAWYPPYATLYDALAGATRLLAAGTKP